MPLKLSILSYWPTFGVPFTLLETSIDCLKNQVRKNFHVDFIFWTHFQSCFGISIKEKALRKSQSLTSCILHLMDFLTLLKLIRPPSLLSLDSLERSRCVLLLLFICVHKSTMLGLAECQVQLICLLKSIVTLQCKM